MCGLSPKDVEFAPHAGDGNTPDAQTTAMTHSSPLPEWLHEHVPLALFTTLELGGCARYFTEPRSTEALEIALLWANSQNIRVLILGGGSNVLVSDDEVDALVIRVANQGITLADNAGTEHDPANTAHVRVAAGERWDDFVKHCVDRGWSGVECLSGIPGTVGATPVQNVGAYGQEVSERIESVTVIDRHTGGRRTVSAAECEFAYRDSAFKREGHELSQTVIAEVTFALSVGSAPVVRYKELRDLVATRHTNAELTPAQIREAVLLLRRSKSMVIEAGDENRRSVGSFFTNPIVSRDVSQRIMQRALQLVLVTNESEVPHWPMSDGRIKLSAAWLIERAGWKKGTREGHVGVSSRHSLALVHHGGGSARELLAFAERIRESVRSQWGVTLEFEPVQLR